MGPMIKFRSMAIHLSALKFVGLQLKKNIPYRVHRGWVRIHQKRIPRVVVLCEFVKCHLTPQGPSSSPFPSSMGGLPECLL